jgi:putative transposase
MMLLRDLIRRHGRMPDFIITDHGSDFESNDFQRVAKLYGGHIRYRAKSEPRGGAVLERLFGTINTEYIHNLDGNTKLMKYVRTVTKSVNPKYFTTWTIPALHGGFDYFFEKVYGCENHPALAGSPNDIFDKRIIETGERRNKWVRYDRFFKIETLPDVKPMGTRVVDLSRGVKVNHVYYMPIRMLHT